MYGDLIIGGSMTGLGQVVCFLETELPSTIVERNCIAIIQEGEKILWEEPKLIKCCSNKAVLFRHVFPGSDMEKFILRNKEKFIQALKQ
ncbi:MAG: hypothetical protein WDA13_01095 [Candidatus Shapirobacteria bacterium]